MNESEQVADTTAHVGRLQRETENRRPDNGLEQDRNRDEAKTYHGSRGEPVLPSASRPVGIATFVCECGIGLTAPDWDALDGVLTEHISERHHADGGVAPVPEAHERKAGSGDGDERYQQLSNQAQLLLRDFLELPYPDRYHMSFAAALDMHEGEPAGAFWQIDIDTNLLRTLQENNDYTCEALWAWIVLTKGWTDQYAL